MKVNIYEIIFLFEILTVNQIFVIKYLFETNETIF